MNEEEKIDHPAPSNAGKDSLMSIAEQLMKNETTIDMSSIMRMASNMLTDDSLLNSVQKLGNLKQNLVPVQPSVSETLDNGVTLFQDQLTAIANEITELRKELADVQAQNKELTEIIKNLAIFLKSTWY